MSQYRSHRRADLALVLTIIALVVLAVVVVAIIATHTRQQATPEHCPPGMTLTTRDDVWVYEYQGETREHPITIHTCVEGASE